MEDDFTEEELSSIQIQLLLKLNSIASSTSADVFLIQIQLLLKLNLARYFLSSVYFFNSNTTLVKVKCPQCRLYQHLLVTFKYNSC